MKREDVYKIFPNIKSRHDLSNKLIRKYMTIASSDIDDNVHLFTIYRKSSILLDLDRNIAYCIFYSSPFIYTIKSDIEIVNDSCYIMLFDDLEITANMSFDANNLCVEYVLRPENIKESGVYKSTNKILLIDEEYIKNIELMEEILKTSTKYLPVWRNPNSFWYV
jgi:hypothetical protein